MGNTYGGPDGVSRYRGQLEESNQPHRQGLSYALVGRRPHFQISSKVRTRKIESQGSVKNSGGWKHKEITLTKVERKEIIEGVGERLSRVTLRHVPC